MTFVASGYGGWEQQLSFLRSFDGNVDPPASSGPPPDGKKEAARHLETETYPFVVIARQS
jgi:hypothetical protein